MVAASTVESVEVRVDAAGEVGQQVVTAGRPRWANARRIFVRAEALTGNALHTGFTGVAAPAAVSLAD